MHYIKFQMKWSNILYAIIKHTECRRAKERRKRTHIYTFETHVKIIWTSYSLSNKIQIKHNEKNIRNNNQARKRFLFDLIWFWNGHFPLLLLLFSSLNLISHQIDWLTEQVPFGDKYFELNDTNSTLNVFIELFSISISIFSCLNFNRFECEWTSAQYVWLMENLTSIWTNDFEL